jgi:hypothetical protein
MRASETPSPLSSIGGGPENRSTGYTCRCGAHWGGLSTGHCSACHLTFTGITAFDKHRTGSHANDTRACLDPASVGLVDANRAYPCWGFPGGDNHWTDGGDAA